MCSRRISTGGFSRFATRLIYSQTRAKLVMENKNMTKTNKKKPAKAAKTKAATVLAMLKRPGGATGVELMKATGWQSHTVRAFISRLGQKMKIKPSYSAEGHRCYAVAG
jgi:hypothetical protein